MAKDRSNVDLLELLAEFYEQTQRPDDVARALGRCIEVEPRREQVYFALAAVLEQLGRENEILDLYARLCVVSPELATAHFNRAVYLRRAGRLDEAADAYRSAIDLGIDSPADAWSNLGVVLGELERHVESRDAFVRALVADAEWTPALYNLGLLHEEFDEREAALEKFERVLAIDPDHHEAFARVVHASVARRDDDSIAERVRLRLQRTDLSPAARETLSFALADALDAYGHYDEAFVAYAAGNAIARGRAQPYDRVAEEHDLAMLAGRFDASWVSTAPSVSAVPLVFVCGMWRSGTTLLERMLGGHPMLTPGGEISYFNPNTVNESIRLAGTAVDATVRFAVAGTRLRRDARTPLSRRQGDQQATGYVALHRIAARTVSGSEIHRHAARSSSIPACRSSSSSSTRLSFPSRPISVTLRIICAGVAQLMRHWKTLFPDQILEVQYEELVNRPERTLEEVCGFLGLAWEPRMLEFATQHSRVRTASVWQVREPVHARSVGRWRHYRTHLRAIVETLGMEQP